MPNSIRPHSLRNFEVFLDSQIISLPVIFFANLKFVIFVTLAVLVEQVGHHLNKRL